jgi:hypothetical protein
MMTGHWLRKGRAHITREGADLESLRNPSFWNTWGNTIF